MKGAIILSMLLATSAPAAPDPAALIRSVMPPGFAAAGFDVPAPVPAPLPVLMAAYRTDTQSVALTALLDRHLSTTDSFDGAAGKTLLGGTLDINGDGYLAVTPPGGIAPSFIKIERSMSGTWHDGVHWYKVKLSISIFRPRLANFIVVTDSNTGKVVWEKRISELFRLTYRAGEPVTIGGRPYRLFYSKKPTFGVCFIYDEVNDGDHDYKFYMIPMNQIQGAVPTSYKMYGGDVVKLQASPDLSTLYISR